MPFTVHQFFDVFEAYNADLPFAWLVLSVCAVAVVVFSIKTPVRRTSVPLLILALMWLWTGVVYHIEYFSQVNPAAPFFGALFIAQSLLLVIAASRLQIGAVRRNVSGVAGALIAAYALLIYPLLNAAAGHHFPRAPTFGLPCPLVIFTFGVLLWSRVRPPIWVMMIPMVWAAIGSSAVFFFGIWPDIGLAISAITFLVLMRRMPEVV